MHGDEYRDQLAAAHAPEEHATGDARGRVRSDAPPRARVEVSTDEPRTWEAEQVTADEAREDIEDLGSGGFQMPIVVRYARTVVALHAEADDLRAQVEALTAERDSWRDTVTRWKSYTPWRCQVPGCRLPVSRRTPTGQPPMPDLPTPEEVAAVLVKHADHNARDDGSCKFQGLQRMPVSQPCLPYRLALLAQQQAQALRGVVNALGPDGLCECGPDDFDVCGLRDEAQHALDVARRALANDG